MPGVDTDETVTPSSVIVELVLDDGNVMSVPDPLQVSTAEASGRPFAVGEQATAARAGLGVNATPETAIAAPATIGSKTILAFARLRLDALLRRLLRRVSPAERLSIL